ncbi:MAG: MFS transporter [Gammaproteobacteria bacterium]|nr:MFS transporter [Gammaproteobacteria bacterium]
MGVLLGLYLAELGFSAGRIGLVIGSGLSGAALSALIVTFLGDRLGRRRSLVTLAALAAGGGFGLAASTHLILICTVAFTGMVNGMGRDRGAALVLEQAILPQTSTPASRTRAYAWYNVTQDAGHALGGLLAALPALLESATGASELNAFRLTIGLYAALQIATAGLYLGLSSAVESRAGTADRHAAIAPAPRLSPASRQIVVRISSLFAIDSLAGGFLGTALLSYFFFEHFGASATAIAILFFLARVANTVSHLGAAWLARHIGLVNTMVFTHIPSSLALVAVAFAPSFWIAAVLFLLREALVEMDVPTRQSYVMAVVRPEERTFVSGVTNLVRMGGWAVAPFAAGFLMQGVALVTPILLGAGMKISYDLLLWKSFRDLKPREEEAVTN